VKRYIVDGNVTDTRHVVGFASERLFVDYTDHAALLRAVAKEVGKMRHDRECFAHTLISDGPFTMKWIIDDAQCNCPRGKVLAMLEVEK